MFWKKEFWVKLLKKKKKKVITIKKHYILGEDRYNILWLLDQYNKNPSKLNSFVFWKKVSELFPEVDITKDSWDINTDYSLTPYIVQTIVTEED